MMWVLIDEGEKRESPQSSLSHMAPTKRMSIQVGSPLSLSPPEKKPTENHHHRQNRAHPSPRRLAKLVLTLRKSKRQSPPTMNKYQGLVVVDHQKTKEEIALIEYLKEKDLPKIIKIQTHLNLLNSFNFLINLSRLTLSSFNSTTATKKDTQNQDGLGKQEEDEELADSFYHLALFRFELLSTPITLKFKDEQQTKLPKISNTKNNQDYDILLTTEYLPPLDVLFVWYCYTLNSRNYYEDGLRLYPILKHLRFPLELAAHELIKISRLHKQTSEYELTSSKESLEKLGPTDTDIGEEEIKEMMHKIKQVSDPTHTSTSTDHSKHHADQAFSGLLLPKSWNTKAGLNARELWMNLTNTPFNLIEFINSPGYRTFICPNCDDTIESPFYVKDPKTKRIKVTDECWPYTSPSKASRSESISSVPREALLVEDKSTITITNKPQIDRHSLRGSHKNHALLSCESCHWIGIKQDLSLCKFRTELNLSLVDSSIKIGNLPFLPIVPTPMKESILDHLVLLNQIRKTIDRTILKNKLVPTTERFKIKNSFQNLLKSYSVPEPFSVDLIRSMKIETFFIRKMVHLGWTDINNNSRNGDGSQVTRASWIVDYRVLSAPFLQHSNSSSHRLCTRRSTDMLVSLFFLASDLAWKTDRLRGIEYTESMMQTNRNLINHPNELGLDKSKFLAHFRLTSALWVHRYNIGYSRYPAPYLKIDRRQDWLKKAIKELDPPTESIPTIKDAERARSPRKQSLQSAATSRSPTSSSTTRSVTISDDQSLESYMASIKPPIAAPLEPKLISPETPNTPQSARPDSREPRISINKCNTQAQKGKQVIRRPSSDECRLSAQAKSNIPQVEPQLVQPQAKVDTKHVDDQSKDSKIEYRDKGKQVAQPEVEGSDSSSILTKYSAESPQTVGSSPEQEASEQYARKIYLEYTRPTPVTPAQYARKQEEDRSILICFSEQYNPHHPNQFSPLPSGSKTRSSRIQSDFSTSSANQTKIDKRNEYPNPVERCTPSRPQLGGKKPSRHGQYVDSHTPQIVTPAGSSSQTDWRRGPQRNHPSLHIQAIRGEAPTFSKVPTTPETSPSTFAKLPPRQSTSPSTRKTVPDPPRPPHPITSKPIFHQALPHQSISKRKLAIIEPVDLDFADNNFIIPVGKIAFVEDGNRLRCL
ncbi:hypothetical protein PSHT_06185 [Puccinia striiformis]|uniref:Uncharacterized protein n=1 Tax=Puccinia striiformis TaxID=27350 RepID=A0A2S4W8Q6_9BASI|nr:hypothetical protein PSHT_06185 [Puccinia striiformis]